MGPVSTNGSKDVPKRIGSEGINENGKRMTYTGASLLSYFVIVPSISDMTTRSSSSQRKIRAVHDATPEYEEETEKIILLAPCFS